MANVIRHKRGTSKPSSSDLLVGEIGIDTALAKLFTESDSGYVWEAGELLGSFSSSTITYTVTVASKTSAHRYNGTGSGSGYKINGVFAPFLSLTPGNTYRFDQSDSSNSNHPLKFYLEADKSTLYSTGVTINGTAGQSGAYTEITISDTTPLVLHYQCGFHGYMGNSVLTNSKTVNYNDLQNQPSLFSGNYNDLSNKPSLFSGSYNDLSDKPTIPTNNNQLTNGAGYITSYVNTQLSNEQVQDIVGGMVSSNSETNITVDYDDATGKLNFSSVNTTYSVGDGGLTQNNFTNSLKTKLDGIEAGAEVNPTNAETKTAYEANSDTNAFTDSEKTKLSGIADSANNYSISADLLDEDNMASNSATKVPSQQSVKAYVDANSSDTTYSAGNGLTLTGTTFSVDQIALTTVQTAANESAQLGLTTQEGDIVVRTDQNKSYVRNSGSAGTMADFTELLTPTDQVLSINGNTGAISAAQIAAAVEAASNSNTFTDADHSKLGGIESGATGDQTPNEILTAIKTVDGASSGLDADLLDGQQGSYYLDYNNFSNTPSIPTNNNQLTNGAGYITSAALAGASDGGNAALLDGIDSTQFLRADQDDTSTGKLTLNPSADEKIVLSGSSNPYIRFKEGSTNKAYIQWNASGYFLLKNDEDSSALRIKDSIDFSTDGSTYYSIWHGGNDGSGSGLDADLLDGQQGSYYLDYNNFSNTPTIPTNNNQLTNGAGYVTQNTQLSNEQVQDIVGAMVSGNSETNISVTYDDSNGKLNFSSTDTNTTYSVGDGGLTQKNFTTTLKNKLDGIAAGATNTAAPYYTSAISVGDGGLTQKNFTTALKNKLDGIAAGATNVTNNNQLTNGAGYSTFSGSYNDLSNKPSLFSGSYNDLSNKPTIPTNNNQLTNGAGYITSVSGQNYNSLSNKPTIPTNNNQLSNGAGYSTYSSNQATNTNSSVTFASIVSSGNVTAYSDLKLKTEIHTIKNPLDMVTKLRGVNYKWLNNGQPDIGVIAQEVEEVIPEIVKETNDGIKTVDYGRMVSVLIESIKELNAKVKILEGKN